MSAQHPDVKKLREFQRWRRGADTQMMPPAEIGELIDRATRVYEAADRLVNGKGRQPDANYRRLEEAVRGQ